VEVGAVVLDDETASPSGYVTASCPEEPTLPPELELELDLLLLPHAPANNPMTAVHQMSAVFIADPPDLTQDFGNIAPQVNADGWKIKKDQ
jgi:hypothetical protein